MSEENDTLREAALAAIEEERDGQTLSAESEEASAGIVAAGADEDTPAFEGMSASDVGGAVVPAAQIQTEDEGAARGPVEDTGITADETEVEAAVEAGEITKGEPLIEDEPWSYPEPKDTVFLLTSASYGVVGQGVHVVGVFESEEAAIGYRDGAEPRVSDGVITEYVVE